MSHPSLILNQGEDGKRRRRRNSAPPSRLPLRLLLSMQCARRRGGIRHRRGGGIVRKCRTKYRVGLKLNLKVSRMFGNHHKQDNAHSVQVVHKSNGQSQLPTFIAVVRKRAGVISMEILPQENGLRGFRLELIWAIMHRVMW